jgi:hypothetical protein
VTGNLPSTTVNHLRVVRIGVPLMSSKREQVLSALFGQLQAIPLAAVNRKEPLPASVPRPTTR